MSSFSLKIFALLFMIIDHIGFIIFPENLLLRAIGRLAFPLFAYQMAVGFSHTKSKEKHIIKAPENSGCVPNSTYSKTVIPTASQKVWQR